MLKPVSHSPFQFSHFLPSAAFLGFRTPGAPQEMCPVLAVRGRAKCSVFWAGSCQLAAAELEGSRESWARIA